jgi:hypothetical protein
VKVSVNKKTPAGMRLLKKLTSGLELVPKWEPVKLEDIPEHLKPLIAKAYTTDDEGDDEDEDDNDSDSQNAGAYTVGRQPGGGQLQAKNSSAPSSFVRDTLEEYEPYMIAAVAVLTLYNTLRRGKLR